MGSGGDYGERRTLASGIDDLHKTHFVVHYELFSVRILYCWIIGLRIGENHSTMRGWAAGESADLWSSESKGSKGDVVNIGQRGRGVIIGSSPTKQLRVNLGGGESQESL